MDMDKKENAAVFSMVYTLQTLHNRGILIQDTIQMSFACLRDWYQMSGDFRYLELELLQMRACFELGISGERNIALYTQICELANVSLEEVMMQGFGLAKRLIRRKEIIIIAIKKAQKEH